MPKDLIGALKKERVAVRDVANSAPDWKAAAAAFDALFRKMANPQDALWSKAFIDALHTCYFKARDEDKECANIAVRTANAMPAAKRNDTKKVLLEIASVCRVFNAAHKVNFSADELPNDFTAVPMVPAKKAGVFTYGTAIPSLYPKTSLTFDYWVPKMLDWTQEIRALRIVDWKNGTAANAASCTDFMNVCITFLSNPADNIPIAKTDDREAFLELLGEAFIWKKKSAKREDVPANSAALKVGLARVATAAGMDIPTEAWSRLQHAPFIKALLT
ncbi:MAG TPA: hypothetical protein VJ717_04910 [Gemmatimonadaceae bacterium]|nr:hypothetical protein [Gemmatimonadaceae bacterium]